MIENLLRRHDGVITGTQARGEGISQDTIERKVRSGSWRRLSRGVYFADDRPFTDAARIRAAVWAHGDRATASGLAAAWWLNMARWAPTLVEVTVPRASNHPRRTGIRLRRRDLDPADVIINKELRVTAAPLTAIEAAVRRGGGPKLIDEALQRDVPLRTLWTAHLRNKGRHGSPAARRMLRAADGGARSEAERLFKQLLTVARITDWKANQRIAGYEVDFVFTGPKVAIEIDGLAFHSDSDAFHHDRVKQNAIALAGWQVLRFTWIDLVEYPDRVIAEVRRALGDLRVGTRAQRG